MMRIYDMEQRSDEWFAIRRGVITGTRVKEVFKSNNLPLVDKMIGEMYSDEKEEQINSASIQRGVDLEPHAIKEFERYTGHKVDQVGFCLHPERDWLGLSPDGLVSVDGKYKIGVEIKCPNTSTHVRYIRTNRIPSEYKFQLMDYFLVNPDCEKVAFVSYDNRFEIKPIHILWLNREDYATELAEIDAGLCKFKEKFDQYREQVTF